MPEADIRRAVERVLQLMQLPEVAQRLPRALSGGQQQRIALARCLVFEPRIVLMDEPLGALDKKLRDQLQLEIKHLHRELGTTILYVTHDQQETLTMSDRVCLMNRGRIEQLGTPEEIYFRPATLFAADFLGESNFFDLVVRSRSDGIVELGAPAQPDRCIRAPDGPAAASTRVRLMVRPERLAVVHQPVDGHNALAGTLRESIFVGGTTRHYVDLDGMGAVFGLQLTTPGGYPLRAGERVFATWPVDGCVVLPDAA